MKTEISCIHFFFPKDYWWH